MAYQTGEISIQDITDITTWDRSEERTIELLDLEVGVLAVVSKGQPLLESLEGCLMDRM